MQCRNPSGNESPARSDQALLEKAITLVRGRASSHVSYESLRRELSISVKQSLNLLEDLVKVGVIGERERAGHPILPTDVLPSTQSSAAEPPPPAVPASTMTSSNGGAAVPAATTAPPDEPLELTLSPDDIRDEPAMQIRAELNADKVEEYREQMEQDDGFPPLLVFRQGETFYLLDGFHRLAAARLLKRKTVRVRVVNATIRDAILFALDANSKHGLAMSRADKRKAATILLRDPEWKQFTDADIGRRCGLSGMSVGRYRDELYPDNNNVKGATRKRRGADGKVRTINVGKQGRKRQQEPVLNIVDMVTHTAATPAPEVDLGGIERTVQQLINHIDDLLAKPPTSLLTFCRSDPDAVNSLCAKATALVALLTTSGDAAAPKGSRSAA